EIFDSLDKEVTFISIYKVGWREKARKDYKEHVADCHRIWREGHKEYDADKANKRILEIFGTEDEYVSHTPPLACFTKGAHIHYGWGDVNVEMELLAHLYKAQGDKFEDNNTTDNVVALVKTMPDKYEIVEEPMQMRHINKWLEDKEYDELVN